MLEKKRPAFSEKPLPSEAVWIKPSSTKTLLPGSLAILADPRNQSTTLPRRLRQRAVVGRRLRRGGKDWDHRAPAARRQQLGRELCIKAGTMDAGSGEKCRLGGGDTRCRTERA